METVVYVEEVHGGTAGTDYIYFIISKKLVHVSQLPSVKVREELEGRGRRLVV